MQSTRLSLALAAANLGDWSWEAATDAVTFSDRACEIFGVPRGQAVTWTGLRELLHADDRERARVAVQDAIATRSDYDIEYRVQLPDGGMRWVHARGRALYDDAGRATSMVGVVADITRDKALDESLRQRTETLQLLNQVGLVVAAELDQERMIKAVTDAGTAMVGAEFGAFFYNVTSPDGGSYMLYTLSGVSRAHFDRFPMPRATPLFAPTFSGERTIRIADVHQDPRYGKFAPWYGMPPGHLPVTSYLSVPVRSRNGPVLGGLFFGHSKRDVFNEIDENAIESLSAYAAVALDNARLFQSASAAKLEAERANRLKDEFLATLSHELRTPLQAIIGWSYVLKNSKLSQPDHDNAVESILRNVKAQQRLIEDILDVSRIITGKLRLDVGTVDLPSVLNAAIEAVRPALESKQLRLSATIDQSGVEVMGDGARLQQVFWNLLSNAIKFTQKEGRIRVTLARVESNVEVTVGDSGQGIAPEILPHIFERFWQADSSITREHGGLGLGLAIVRHLVELHGGSVSVASEGPGKGATFSVRLPLPAAKSQARMQPRSEPVPASSTANAVYSADLSGLRVVAVDDEEGARVLISAVLGGQGAEVTTAPSAAEGLRLVRELQPDVVISDIGMPGEDGLAFIRKVRVLDADAGGRTPAIALTAYARADDRLRCLAAGFQTHVAKPVEPAELVGVVASMTGRAFSS